MRSRLDGFWGFYCPLDQKMYLDEKLLDDLKDQGYYFAAAFVIAHEWAHHVQSGIGLTRTSSPTHGMRSIASSWN